MRPVWLRIFGGRDGNDSSNKTGGSHNTPAWSTNNDMASKRARTKQIQASGGFDDPVQLHSFTMIEDDEGFPARTYAPRSARGFGTGNKEMGNSTFPREVSKIVSILCAVIRSKLG